MNKTVTEPAQPAGVKQYYFTSRNFFQKRNDSCGSSNTHDTLKKNSYKMGLFKIAEDEGYNEYDDSDEESKEIAKFHLKKLEVDKKAKMIDDYSSREKSSCNIRKLNSKADPLSKTNK